MTIREHADRTEALVGHRAEDIHRWIDRFFDAQGFADFLRRGYQSGYDPYAHRKYRHCREALDDALREFDGSYPAQIITAVFERHIRDDYDGYFPYRDDFETGGFREKYHEADRLPDSDDLAAYFRGRHYETMASAARKRGIRFLWRFILPVFAALILLVGSLFMVIVPVSRENMMSLKKDMIRELTAVAVGALEHYASRAGAGALSDDEARAEAAREIRRMRYGPDGKDYYWIIDGSAFMVMHPYRPELEGRDLSNYRDREDTDGVYLFREAAELGRTEGEGYIEYWWQHWDDPGAKAPKLSYVRYFPDWDWIVGTGIYIHDVELEIQRLTRRLGAVFGGIAALSIALLAWVLAGALRVERRRDAAEEGLRDTRERYRALAEASAEGYMLLAEGAVLYANPAMCRLTGRGEEDLMQGGPRSLLDSGVPDDHPARKALEDLAAGGTPTGSWTVAVAGPEDQSRELLLALSRVFLPGAVGSVVSLRRPVTAAERIGDIGTADAVPSPRETPSAAAAVAAARDRPAALEAAGEMGRLLTELMRRDASPGELRTVVAETYEALVVRLADLAAEELDLEPSRFCLISLGSNARREMTPFSDQDGALIVRGNGEQPPEAARNQGLILAAAVTDGLEAAGFPRCDGGVMPVNPRWCLTPEEWDGRIEEWIADPKPQALLELNVLLDRRRSWGDSDLFRNLDAALTGLPRRSPALVSLYRRSTTLHRPPSLRRGRDERIDIKEALKPLEIQLRLLALEHGLPASGTLERLRSLQGAGVIPSGTARDLKLAFETFWTLRFHRQLEDTRLPVRRDDAVNVAELSGIERANLSACLDAVEAFVKRRALEIGV